MKTTTNNPHPSQVAYAAARAAFETIDAERDRQVAALTVPVDDIDRHCDAVSDIEESLGYWSAYEVLLKAEEAMVEYVRAAILANPRTARRFSQIALAFDKWRTSRKTRDQMVAIRYRFAA